MADRAALAEIIQSPQWRDKPGETISQSLNRARGMLAKSRSRQTAHKGSNAALDNQLKQMADKAYRR
jgi:hypothetical protein